MSRVSDALLARLIDPQDNRDIIQVVSPGGNIIWRLNLDSSQLYTSAGAPVTTTDNLPGDVLIDTVNGNWYQLTAGAWVVISSGSNFVYTGVKSGLPATCTVGQIAFVTDAVAGYNIFECSTTNVWSQAGFPNPSQTVSPLQYGGIADAITIAPVDLSGGGTTLVSAGLFTPDLVGKVGTCLLNNDAGSFGGALFTVTGYTSSNSIQIDIPILRAFAGQSCTFASQNFRPALLAAQAAVVPGGTLQLPCGNMLINGGQILSSFAGVPSGSTINIAGCPGWGTHFIMDYSSMSLSGSTPAVLTPNGVHVYLHDITFDSVGSQQFIQASSGITALVTLYTGDAANIGVYNWAVTTPSGECAGFSGVTDGTTWNNVAAGGCNTGLFINQRGVRLHNDHIYQVSGCPALHINGQEQPVSIEGMFIGSGTGCQTIHVSSNANASVVNFVNTQINVIAGGIGLGIADATQTMQVNFINGVIANPVSGNVTGVYIGSNVVFRPFNSQIDSQGTGYSIQNAGGTFMDLGGNFALNQGAGFYTGTGNVNGKTVMSSVYTNSTTGFTPVVGATGEAFQWHLEANQFLTVSMHLYYQAASTGGLNIEFTGPASPTFVTYALTDPSTAAPLNVVATAYGTSLGQAVGTAATNYDATVTFTVQNGSTAGTVTLLAKSSAAAALTIQPGSFAVSN